MSGRHVLQSASREVEVACPLEGLVISRIHSSPAFGKECGSWHRPAKKTSHQDHVLPLADLPTPPYAENREIAKY